MSFTSQQKYPGVNVLLLSLPGSCQRNQLADGANFDIYGMNEGSDGNCPQLARYSCYLSTLGLTLKPRCISSTSVYLKLSRPEKFRFGCFLSLTSNSTNFTATIHVTQKRTPEDSRYSHFSLHFHKACQSPKTWGQSGEQTFDQILSLVFTCPSLCVLGALYHLETLTPF